MVPLTNQSGAMTLTTLLLYRETYRPILLRRKLARIQKSNPSTSLVLPPQPHSASTTLLLALTRPLKLLFLAPTVTIACLASALMFAYYYLLITTFPLVFEEQYGFNPTQVGLSYFGLGVGNMLGVLFFAATSDRHIKAVARRRDIRPEDRLQPLYIGSPIVAIGFLWYGWSSENQLHVSAVIPHVSSFLYLVRQ